VDGSGAEGRPASIFGGRTPAVRGAIYGLAAATLFGLSAPFAKALLPSIPSLMLAALLYLGAGLAMLVIAPLTSRKRRHEAALRRSDIPLLIGITVSGGVIGPLLLLVGLRLVSGVAGSLLLNLEAVFTMLIAVLIFREHLGKRESIAAAVIILGAAVLGYSPGQAHADWRGVLAISGACLAWGLDNNLTQRLSVKDPFAIVRIKALGAGTFSLVLALLIGQRIPGIRIIAAAVVLGIFSYGMSILLDAYALRHLGAAREAAFFATAPFIGALGAVPILGEYPRLIDFGGMLAMAAGVILLLRPNHDHVHAHVAMSHEHMHVHDEHHRHSHPDGEHEGESHSHPHLHDPVTHSHPHVSDVHHRHEH